MEAFAHISMLQEWDRTSLCRVVLMWQKMRAPLCTKPDGRNRLVSCWTSVSIFMLASSILLHLLVEVPDMSFMNCAFLQ